MWPNTPSIALPADENLKLVDLGELYEGDKSDPRDFNQVVVNQSMFSDPEDAIVLRVGKAMARMSVPKAYELIHALTTIISCYEYDQRVAKNKKPKLTLVNT